MTNSIHDLLSAAAAAHDAGNLPVAEMQYRQIVDEHPDSFEAWTLLGDVLSDAIKPNEAAECYQRVISAKPDSPSSADAYDGLAAIFQERGQLATAIGFSRRAIELRADANAAYVLGCQLEQLQKADEAMSAFTLATNISPRFAEAHAKIGAILLANNRPADAQRSYRAAIDARPTMAEAHCNLATALLQTGEENEAMDCARRAIELKPELAEAHNVLGAILKNRRRPSDALAEFEKAVNLKPEYAEAINNGASVLEELGRFDDAARYYELAVQLRPKSPEFHENLACNLLVRGKYSRGWQEYEWRRLQPRSSAGRNFGWPQWDGSPLNGKTILLHAEQGVGDTIQFARFVPMVRDRGGKVIVECQPSIAPVIATIDGVQQVIIQGHPIRPFEVHSPLISLPLIFGITIDTVPASTPYVRVDPDRVSQFASKLPNAPGKKRVGLVWAGNPRHKNDRNRSCPAAMLEPLASLENIEWFSLQKNAVTPAPPSLKAIDLTRDLKDFADTAALLSQLDLLVTVDTALAHLAGALNKPVWVMLPFAPDWRWLTDREDSPWYPSVKLFRQNSPGDWKEVISRVIQELTER